MSKLIDYLESIDLLSLENLYYYIEKCDIATVNSLVIYIRQLIDEDYRISEYTPFIFVPNGDIAGTGGCKEISCRMRRAIKFAGFSALYADKVYIQLEFITHEHYELVDIEEIERDEEQCHRYKEYVLDDIAIILVYAELIRSKVVYITPSHRMLCQKCFQKEVFGKNIIDVDAIKKEYLLKAQVILKEYDHKNRMAMINIDNIDEFFPDHSLFWTVTSEKDLEILRKESVGKEIQDKVFTEKFVNMFISDEILDAMYTTKYCNEQNAKLITNKNSDAMFLALNRKNQKLEDIKEYTSILPEYDLPIVKNISLKDIIKLRQEEAKSFNKYRIAINKAVIEQNKTTNKADWKKIYDDLVYPELNNLDMKMKQIRSGRLNRFFGTMLVVGTALVASKYGDMIKPDLFSSAQALGTSVGAAGINFILDKTSTKKCELQNNDFFFLWKLKKENN